ncbi:CrcB family protein [Arthrobacter sp. ISL-30]|uniref:fluoride efflux transporter FluC n=1 Tax=Arthrobacter sp. ISL-30 TaxID=2819109 RepID=UPI001BEB3236|nr:CrcB family protein [Arthrobacter sp. ISL-30]MBT2513909.1 CrcB family protein [Arthrobacter sp. ISL-30]
MLTAALVGLFGVAGALLRFSVDAWFARRTFSGRTEARRHWPWATLIVNVAGSFIIGISIGLSKVWQLDPVWHTAVATGLAGGLTTFSSWTTATVRLVSENRYSAAGLNVAMNLVAGLGAAALGITLAG